MMLKKDSKLRWIGWYWELLWWWRLRLRLRDGTQGWWLLVNWLPLIYFYPRNCSPFSSYDFHSVLSVLNCPGLHQARNRPRINWDMTPCRSDNPQVRRNSRPRYVRKDRRLRIPSTYTYPTHSHLSRPLSCTKYISWRTRGTNCIRTPPHVLKRSLPIRIYWPFGHHYTRTNPAKTRYRILLLHSCAPDPTNSAKRSTFHCYVGDVPHIIQVDLTTTLAIKLSCTTWERSRTCRDVVESLFTTKAVCKVQMFADCDNDTLERSKRPEVIK